MNYRHENSKILKILLPILIIVAVLLFVFLLLLINYNNNAEKERLEGISEQQEQEQQDALSENMFTLLDNEATKEEDKLVSVYDVLNNNSDGKIILDSSQFYNTATLASAFGGSNAIASAEISYTIPKDEIAILQFEAHTEDDITVALNVWYGGSSSTVWVSPTRTTYYIPIAGECNIDKIQFTMSGEDFVPTIIDEVYLTNYGEMDIAELRTGVYEEYKCSISVINAEDYAVKGNITQCLVDGDYLYTLESGTLSVYRCSSDEYNLICECSDMGETRDMVFSSDKQAILITARLNGMYILDISNPYDVSIVSHYATLDHSTGIAVSENYAFVCSRFFGIEIVDISDIYAPKYISQVSESSEYQDCFVSDGYLYAGVYNQKRIDIFDISNLAQPVLCSQIDLDGSGQGCYVEDGILYAATGLNSANPPTTSITDFGRGTGNGLEIYDVSDPYAPVHLSTSKTLGRFSYNSIDVWDVTVSGDLAYLSSMYNGIYIFDITNPKDPTCVNIIQVEATSDSEFYEPLDSDNDAFPFDTREKTMGCVFHVNLNDGYMYAVVRNMGVYKITADYITPAREDNPYSYNLIFNETTIPNIENCKVSLYENENSIYAVAAYSDFYYVACGDGGIAVLDKELNLKSTYSTQYAVLDLKMANGYLYSAENEGGIGIWAVDGTTLERISTFCPYKNKCFSSLGMTVDGNFVIAQTARSGDYVVVDMRNKQSPIEYTDSVSEIGLSYYRNICSDVESAGLEYLCIYGDKLQSWYSYDGNNLDHVNDIANEDYYSRSGGMTAVQNYAVYIKEGGYYYCDPSSETMSSKITIDDVTLVGKCFSNGNLLVVVDCYSGNVIMVNVENIENPYFVMEFSVDGSPDVGIFDKDSILIPCRHYGLLKIDFK